MTMPPDRDAHAYQSTEMQRLFDTVQRLLREGMRHGHFQYEITGIVGKTMRREVVIKAGVSHKFTIPLDDLAH